MLLWKVLPSFITFVAVSCDSLYLSIIIRIDETVLCFILIWRNLERHLSIQMDIENLNSADCILHQNAIETMHWLKWNRPLQKTWMC
jgi:hypothetical protein